MPIIGLVHAHTPTLTQHSRKRGGERLHKSPGEGEKAELGRGGMKTGTHKLRLEWSECVSLCMCVEMRALFEGLLSESGYQLY